MLMTETVPFINLTVVNRTNMRGKNFKSSKAVFNTSQIVSVQSSFNGSVPANAVVTTTNGEFSVEEGTEEILELMFGDEV